MRFARKKGEKDWTKEVFKIHLTLEPWPTQVKGREEYPEENQS